MRQSYLKLLFVNACDHKIILSMEDTHFFLVFICYDFWGEGFLTHSVSS